MITSGSIEIVESTSREFAADEQARPGMFLAFRVPGRDSRSQSGGLHSSRDQQHSPDRKEGEGLVGIT
ncbi:MAG: hypothetical protein R3C49_10835 [Planctomycetaceae bacterium]